MDEYERKYMRASGEVLHRHKAVLPRWVFGVAGGLPAGLAGVTGLGLLAGGVLAWPAALAIAGGGVLYAGGMAALLTLTGVVRLVVSTEEILVQIAGKRLQIPLAEIDVIDVRDARVRNRGIGVRLLLDGTRVYSMLGDPKRAVHIARAGHPPMALVLENPEAFVEAVQRARAQKGAPRARVDVGHEAEAEVDVEAASDAEARRLGK